MPLAFLEKITNLVVFPSPSSSYGTRTHTKHMFWIPWNPSIMSTSTAESLSGLDPDHPASYGIPCLWYPSHRSDKVVLFLHGNAEDIGMAATFARRLREQLKVSVLSVEYPGYGLLKDMEVSESGLHEVARIAYMHLIDRGKFDNQSIIVLGRSIGSAPAVHLASNLPIGGLILISPFTSIKRVVMDVAGHMVSMLFDEAAFSNETGIPHVKCPILFVHGLKDTLVSPRHSLELASLCNSRNLVVTPESLGHNSNLFGDATFLVLPAQQFFGLRIVYAHRNGEPEEQEEVLTARELALGIRAAWSEDLGVNPLTAKDVGCSGCYGLRVDTKDASLECRVGVPLLDAENSSCIISSADSYESPSISSDSDLSVVSSGHDEDYLSAENVSPMSPPHAADIRLHSKTGDEDTPVLLPPCATWINNGPSNSLNNFGSVGAILHC